MTPTPDSILGDTAPLWRETMKNLHAYAQATNCPLGYDVIAWFGEEVARLQDAMRVAHGANEASK